MQRFLREAVRFIRAATDLSGDVNKALFWCRNEPLQPFSQDAGVSRGRRAERGRSALRDLARGGPCRVIFTDLVETIAYRMHVPRWASLPLSIE